MNGKKKRKKVFPHKWAMYKLLPEEVFEPLLFDEFMEWKVAGWMLPDNVFCIIRSTNITTKKVKEYTYKKPFYAEKKMEELASNPLLELCITTHHEQRLYKAIDIDEAFDL